MLENISLADAGGFITWAAGIVAALLVLIKAMKVIIGKMFEEQLEQFGEEIRAISDKIDRVDQTLTERMDIVDMEACKNFLVRCLADVERGEPMAETEKERFYEQYEHYVKNDGNSYIKQKVENLQKAGKI